MPVVPVDVPVLTKVQVSRLLATGLVHVKLESVVIFDEFIDLHDRYAIHNSASIDSIVFSVLQISARLAAAHETLVLDVVNHEAAVVHELGQATCEEDIVVLVRPHHDCVSDISAQTLCIDHAEDRTPALSTAIKQVIDQFQQAIVDAVDVRLFVLLVGAEDVLVPCLKLLGSADLARNNAFEDARLDKKFVIIFQHVGDILLLTKFL